MYTNTRSQSRAGFSPSKGRVFARRSFHNSRSVGTGSPRRFPSRFGDTGGRGRSEKIDISRFVNKVTITEEADNFIPENTFQSFVIDERIKNTITAKGYVIPTPIQDRAIPQVLLCHDVVGIANTGTGKTAAFLIPLIHKILQNRREQVMIIVPTRELAIQIDTELREFVLGMKIFSVCCVGGAPISKQIRDLRYEYNFIIGTPGRLKDLLDRKMIHLNEFNTIVLDEADRMLDMGFINEMRAIMNGMPKSRQTLFFSATISHEIEKLIGEFLREPIRISVKTQDTAKNVDQDIVRVKSGKEKIDTLHDLLIQKDLTKVLIFGRTKHGVEKLSQVLTQRGFKAESIHGDKNQSGRQRALKLFKDNRVQILVATDVAARGLDIANVSHVINYDIPATHDDYVHRIGRTGRAGKLGKALTFVD
jgi:superfamily II DNA/RNA helicase